MELLVGRLQGAATTLVGRIAGTREDGCHFSYDPEYLASDGAQPLSLSLPLSAEPYAQPAFRPYFEGLLPEGEPRARLAAEIEVSENDWLSILSYSGRDCIGDVVISSDGDHLATMAGEFGYEPIPSEELESIFSSPRRMAASNNASRLSLAGTQDKIGLAHAPTGPWDDGWLRPKGLSATTHILKTSELRDLPELEFVCMGAAKLCGIPCATTHLITCGGKAVVVSERFDRTTATKDGSLAVTRVHQEDLAQAFGVDSASKYAELPGGTVGAIASLIRRHSSRPLADLTQLADVLLFNYLVGNCDAHLKNLSLSYGHKGGVRLAPAYDLTSTTYFERFSRDMAMDLGSHRNIDEVAPEDLVSMAAQLQIPAPAVRRRAENLLIHVASGLASMADSPEALGSTPYVVEDLLEDMAPRIRTVRAFAEG